MRLSVGNIAVMDSLPCKKLVGFCFRTAGACLLFLSVPLFLIDDHCVSSVMLKHFATIYNSLEISDRFFRI